MRLVFEAGRVKAAPEEHAWESIVAFRDWLWATLPDLASHSDVGLGSEGTTLVIRLTMDRAAPPEAVAELGQVHEEFRGLRVRTRVASK